MNIIDGLKEVSKASKNYTDGQVTNLNKDLGSLEDLETVDKSSVVAAINEVKRTGGISQNDKMSSFMDNVDIDYEYDKDTNANYSIIRIYKNKLDGTKQYPFVYAPNGNGSGNTTSFKVAQTDGWLLTINSGIFDVSNKKPDGVVIQNRAVVQNTPQTTHTNCKILTIDNNGDLFYAEPDANAYELVNNGIVSAVVGFMPIILNYAIVPSSEWNAVSHYTENAQRQIIGQFGNGDYAILTCEGRGHQNSDGWTIAEAQKICQKHGLKFAYNLDGGGSTETMIGLKHFNTIYEGSYGRIVPTYIVFNGSDEFNIETEESEEGRYQEVPYINLDASKHYIETDITETEIPYDIEYVASVANYTENANHVLSSVNIYYPRLSVRGTTKKISQKINGTERYPNCEYTINTMYKIKGFVQDNQYKFEVYDYETGNIIISDAGNIGTTYDESKKFTLFAYAGDANRVGYRFSGQFKYLKLLKNGSVLHDFVAAKDTKLNIYGVYDKIEKKFYRSSTGTDITA